MRINPCPCNGCENRVRGCHARCPLYLEFRKKREQLYEVRRKNFYTNPIWRGKYSNEVDKDGVKG